jgi:hypothetical protein
MHCLCSLLRVNLLLSQASEVLDKPPEKRQRGQVSIAQYVSDSAQRRRARRQQPRGVGALSEALPEAMPCALSVSDARVAWCIA